MNLHGRVRTLHSHLSEWQSQGSTISWTGLKSSAAGSKDLEEELTFKNRLLIVLGDKLTPKPRDMEL